jgi:transposase InsO family protein
MNIIPMSNGSSASEVNTALLSIFSAFGLAKTIVCDNGPPFDSNEFAAFCTSFNIQILHAPVYHPESNGLAEKGVDIAKKGLKKMLDSTFPLDSSTLGYKEIAVVLHKFLFNYRNTPTSVNLKSPNELLLSFKPTSTLSYCQRYCYVCYQPTTIQSIGGRCSQRSSP